MAAYTLVNLKEVEDLAPKFGFAPNLESRFARVPLELLHSEQEEVYLVVSGNARVKLDDEVLELKTWDAVRIPVGTMRGLEAGPDGAEVLAFGAPDTNNGDIEMTQGWWTD